jgi:DNA end-binding protein Ku
VAEEPVPEDVPRPGDDSDPQRDRSRELKPVSSEENEPPAWDQSNEREDSGSETEVPWEEIVRGYEVEPGRVVAVEPEELESVAPERGRVLEVEQFVDLQEIDPVYFEKSYYVVPQRGAVTQRPYWLLYRAMEKAGKVAIGRFVLRTKEYLVAVRPGEHVLILEALFYADEVRDPKEGWMPSIEEPSERELGLAQQFLESLSGQWEPARHRDEHRERLLDLIQGKAGTAITSPEVDADADVSPVIDLLEALQASVEAAKRAREEDAGAS